MEAWKEGSFVSNYFIFMKILLLFKNHIYRVDLMCQRPKRSYSQFSYALQFYLRVLFPMWVCLRKQWRLIFAVVRHCYRLLLRVGYFIYFRIRLVFFWWMFFNSIKEIDRSRKETNRLLSKWMSNIYSKVNI